MKRLPSILIILIFCSMVACRGGEGLDVPALSTPTTETQPTPTSQPLPNSTPQLTANSQPVTAMMELPGVNDWKRIPLNQTIQVTFDQPMDSDSSRAPIVLQPPVRGIFSWSGDFQQLTFTPEQDFLSNRLYRVVLNHQLRSSSGNRLAENYTWQITTVIIPSATHRTWIASSHPRLPQFNIHFNLPMDTFCLPEGRSEDGIALEASWQDDQNLLITVTDPLTANQTYRFAIEPNCTDQTGVGMRNSYEWHYTPPSLVQSVELHAADNGQYPVELTFGYAMQPASVESAFVMYLGEESEAVAGTFQWDDSGKILTFTPGQPMLGNVDYQITLAAGVLDQAGFSYKDWATEVKTPSPITAHYPQGESVYPTTQISIIFNQPVNQQSIEEAFEIVPEIAGTFRWEENTLFFQPTETYLKALTDYTISLGTGILTANGQPILGKPFHWNFSTSDLRTIAGFGVGTHLQLIDSESEDRVLHFTTYQAQPTQLKLELFALNESQLVQIYPALQLDGDFWSYDPEERELVEVESPLTKEWFITTALIENTEPYWANIYPQMLEIPDDVPAGVYLLNLSAGKLNDQIVVILTPYALIIKEDAQNDLVWLSDFYDGTISGATITAYDETLQPLAQGITDSNGFYRLTRLTERPYLVTARVGDLLTLAGVDSLWQQQWYWGSATYQALQLRPYSAYIYTDRPIYRPGDTVYFKTVVRKDEDAILSVLPAGTPLTARLRDSRKNVVQTLELIANDFGTADGQFTLAEGAMLGFYHVEITVEETTLSQELKVEDYHKPDYAVTVTTDKSRYMAGEEVQVELSAAYFLGEPTSSAQVSVRNYVLSSYYDWRIEKERITWLEPYGMGTVNEQGRMDSAGTYQLSFLTNSDFENSYYYDYSDYTYWDTNLRSEKWAVEATVNDGSNQTVSSYATYTVYNVSEVIRLTTGGYFHRPGQTVPIGITVLDLEGNPVPNRSVTINVRRWNGSSYKYDISVYQQSVITNGSGQTSLNLTLDNAGYYQLFVVGQDARGRQIHTTRWLYIFDRDFSLWYGGASAELSINADRQEYAPGDTAQLVVETSVAGPALLTVQRGTVRREQLVTLTPPVTTLSLPIEEGDIPNVYVTLSVWSPQNTELEEYQFTSRANSVLRQTSVQLSVPASHKRLNITITPNQQTYAPGDQASVTVRVTNNKGEPISAELALAVVDEAIFTLSEELAGPIYDAFYFERGNQVRTYDSMKPMRILWEAGGMGGGGGGDVPINPRDDFEDTAAWFPALRTDANGEATVTFTLPDNLTSWRLTAKAATTDTQIGEATTQLTVTKEIVVRPILPRTLTVGDEMTISAVVSNYSREQQTLSVYLYAGIANPQGSDLNSSRPSPLKITNDITQTITLDPGEQTIVGWSLTAEKPGQAVLIAWANFANGTEADSVELPLTIRPLSVPDVTIEVGSFSGVYETMLNLPEDALELSSVRVELSRSIAGTLLNGLEYLTGYPYGCVEQTMSRALPTAAVARAFFQLGLGAQMQQTELDSKIEASVQRLYGFQHEDGGWGWWFDDDTHDYQTAWVLFGLSVIRDAGYEVDASVLERGSGWLQSNWQSMNLATRAYALYAMTIAGYGDSELADQLLQSGNLDSFSQAALALTLNELGRPSEARQLIDGLLEKATVLENGQVFWEASEGDGNYRQKTMASTTRTTALVLSALVQVRPGHALEGGVVRWLMANRQGQGWGTTNETSYAILGLTDHLLGLGFGNENAGTTYNLLLNGESYASGTLSGGLPTITVEIPASDLKTGENSLRIEQGGRGELYYTINNRVYLPAQEIAAGGAITIQRLYLDPTTNQRLTEVQAGQLVRVRINVNMPQRGSYIIIEDNLPGGLEALNEGLNTTSHDANVYGEDQLYQWQDLGYNYKEIRGDRVNFFVTEMESGAHNFTYMARATHAGTFTAMPTEIYAMYDLTLWGRSSSTFLQIRD